MSPSLMHRRSIGSNAGLVCDLAHPQARERNEFRGRPRPMQVQSPLPKPRPGCSVAARGCAIRLSCHWPVPLTDSRPHRHCQAVRARDPPPGSGQVTLLVAARRCRSLRLTTAPITEVARSSKINRVIGVCHWHAAAGRERAQLRTTTDALDSALRKIASFFSRN